MRAIVIGLTVLLVAAAASYGRDAGEAVVPGTNGKIVFVSDRDGNSEIYVMNADGSGQTNLTNNPGGDYQPVWSPDGNRIAFVSSRDGDDEIYVMNADGSGPTRLTRSADFDGSPAWSPDGKRIAFLSGRDGNWAIYVMDADGSGPTRLTYGHTPAWSPDGKRIAFASNRDGNFEIYVMNADGSGPTRLTNNPAFDTNPNWQAPPVTCTIASVIDGDTFTCTDGVAVDMLQIDAPELGQCGGGWAKAALENIFLTPGRVVRLDFDSGTQSAGANTLAAPVARGNDGFDYNLSIVMVYVGLAKAATVGANNSRFLDWANASQAWAQAAQWNMWAPGKTYTGGCD